MCYQSLFSYNEGLTVQVVCQEGMSHEEFIEKTRSEGEKQMRDTNTQVEPSDKMSEDEEGKPIEVQTQEELSCQRKGKAEEKWETKRYRGTCQRKGKTEEEKRKKQRYRGRRRGKERQRRRNRRSKDTGEGVGVKKDRGGETGEAKTQGKASG